MKDDETQIIILLNQTEAEKKIEIEKIQTSTSEVIQLLDKKYEVDDKLKRMSSIVAIIILVCFYFVVMVNDAWNLIKNYNRINFSNQSFKLNVRLTRPKVGIIKPKSKNKKPTH